MEQIENILPAILAAADEEGREKFRMSANVDGTGGRKPGVGRQNAHPEGPRMGRTSTGIGRKCREKPIFVYICRCEYRGRYGIWPQMKTAGPPHLRGDRPLLVWMSANSVQELVRVVDRLGELGVVRLRLAQQVLAIGVAR